MSGAKTRTAKIVLSDIKDPDGWGGLITELGLDGDRNEKRRGKFFQWSEYASIEIEVDEDMRIVGGRILPL